MATMKNYHEQIRALFPFVLSRDGWRRPEFVVLSKDKYRGKVQYVVGYSHSRMYAHHMSGMTTKRILGHGDTPEAAIDMMSKRLGV